MAEVKFKGLYRVDIIESEAGWGSKVDESKYYETEKEGADFVKAYNDKYNPPLKKGQSTPEWYMIARGPYPVN